ncbi:MAG: hypothetical protein IT260_00935 [Saprospiraceae bacterium]|nr:hypothetical protein [Saprospiraceae bacterium]
MPDTLLAEHLQILLPEERSRFEAFLNSPYCNTFSHPEQQLRLVRHIFQQIKSKPTEKNTENALLRQLFGPGPVPAGKLDKLKTATLQALKQFLADNQRRRQADPADEALWLAACYRERGLHHRFERLAGSLQKELRQRPFSGEAWADSSLRIEEEWMRFWAQHPKAEGDMNLPATISAIDQAWLLRRLLYLMTLLHLRHIRPGTDTPALYDWFETMLPYFEREFAATNPVLRAYLLSVRLALAKAPEEGDAVLEKLLAVLENIRPALPAQHLHALEQHALHYCHRQAYLGRDFAQPVFRIFKSQAEDGRILSQGKISAAIFTSAVVAGLRAGQDAWVEHFIDRFHPFLLEPDAQTDTHAMCQARLYFHRRQFEKAFDLLNGYHSNTSLKIFTRAFELQILYEMDSPLFDARLEAFKILLFREKDIAPEKKETYNRFINILLQLRTPANRHSPARKAKLAEKVRQATSIAERYWLLEKLS